MKYRIKISFEIPDGNNSERVGDLIHQTIDTVKRLIKGKVEMAADFKLKRISVMVSTPTVPPRPDTLKLRFPRLQRLEILDVSPN